MILQTSDCSGLTYAKVIYEFQGGNLQLLYKFSHLMITVNKEPDTKFPQYVFVIQFLKSQIIFNRH